MNAETYSSPKELPKSVILLLVQLAVSAVTVTLVMMETFRVAGCDEDCDYGLVALAFQGTIATTIGAFVVSAVIVMSLGMRRRPSWWAPVAAIVLVLATGVVAALLIRVAT